MLEVVLEVKRSVAEHLGLRGSGDGGETAAEQASVCIPCGSKWFQMQALLLVWFGQTAEDRSREETTPRARQGSTGLVVRRTEGTLQEGAGEAGPAGEGLVSGHNFSGSGARPWDD